MMKLSPRLLPVSPQSAPGNRIQGVVGYDDHARRRVAARHLRDPAERLADQRIAKRRKVFVYSVRDELLITASSCSEISERSNATIFRFNIIYE